VSQYLEFLRANNIIGSPGDDTVLTKFKCLFDGTPLDYNGVRYHFVYHYPALDISIFDKTHSAFSDGLELYQIIVRGVGFDVYY